MATSKKWAMLHAKCPRCRRGNMFVGKVYGLTTNKINQDCPHCGLHFEIEPGYFYAAMYISYALNVGTAVALAFITYMLTKNSSSPWLYSGVIIGGCILLIPNFQDFAGIALIFVIA